MIDKADINKTLLLWRGKLALSHWEIKIMWDEPTADDCNASVWISDDYDNARIHLDVNWPKWSKLQMREHVIHELLHCCMRDVDHVLNKQADGQMHHDVQEILDKQYKHAVERFIDNLARLLARA